MQNANSNAMNAKLKNDAPESVFKGVEKMDVDVPEDLHTEEE